MVQPPLYGNNLDIKQTWLALSKDLQSGYYTAWTFITLVYLKLGFMS